MAKGYNEVTTYREIEYSSTREQRAEYWETGSSLQATDGLEVSEYAQKRAQLYVSGEYSAADLERDVRSHYGATAYETRDAEADIVAARIAGLLEGFSFSLRPTTLDGIHAALFTDVLPQEWVGRHRVVNIEKAEPVLGGRSVGYEDFRQIDAALAYDFEREARTSYRAPLDRAQVSRLARFVAGMWQIHPFREGNTRTIAVFSELYLRSLGVEVDNRPFMEHSELFRDMLVRASFSSVPMGIEEDPSFIEAFFENLALGASHDLGSFDLNLHGVRVDPNLSYRGEEGASFPSSDIH